MKLIVNGEQKTRRKRKCMVNTCDYLVYDDDKK